MPRYKLTIAYDGTHFVGWQKQEPTIASVYARDEKSAAKPADQQTPPEQRALSARATSPAAGPEFILEPLEHRPDRVALRTVQHVVERAVIEVVRERVELLGASRTDSGVHARGQVASFTCSDFSSHEQPTASGPISTPPALPGAGWPLSRGCDRLIKAINSRLPDDVLIVAAQPVPQSFNPIGDCTSKGYSYTIHSGQSRELFDRHRVTQVWDTLNPHAMHEAAQRLLGEHDFAAFAAAGHGRQSTVRTIFDCQVHDLGPPPSWRFASPDPTARRIRIDISGNGFLYNMVRIIAGTLCQVGRGRMTPDDVTKAIQSLDRRNAGPTMPAQGLCLEWVKYANSPENTP